jgi:hypothetical protein
MDDINNGGDLSLKDLRTDYAEPEIIRPISREQDRVSTENLDRFVEVDPSTLRTSPSADELAVKNWENELTNDLAKLERIVLKEADEFHTKKEVAELEAELEGREATLDDIKNADPANISTVERNDNVLNLTPVSAKPDTDDEFDSKEPDTAQTVHAERPEPIPEPKKETNTGPSPIEVVESAIGVKKDELVVKQAPNYGIDEEDFANLDDEEEESAAASDDPDMNNFRHVVVDKIGSTLNAVDLSKFKVSKEVVSVNTVLNVFGEERIIDWVLPNMGRAFSMKEFSGVEIDKLDPDSYNRSMMMTYRDIYKTIYDHVSDSNKPMSFELWAKSTMFSDSDHLYFGVYMASFGNKANFVPYQCHECNHRFLSDHIPVDKMYKFKSPEAEARIKKIRTSDPSTDGAPAINITVKQVSDDVVIGYRPPTIYDMVVGTAALDDDFIQKYGDYINLCGYIDTIYMIDRRSNELRPVAFKVYPNDIKKTISFKIRAVARIMKGFNSDASGRISAMLAELDRTDNDDISYVKPEMDCPKCKAHIPEEKVSASTLVFTRHGLARVVTSLTERNE